MKSVLLSVAALLLSTSVNAKAPEWHGLIDEYTAGSPAALSFCLPEGTRKNSKTLKLKLARGRTFRGFFGHHLNTEFAEFLVDKRQCFQAAFDLPAKYRKHKTFRFVLRQTWGRYVGKTQPFQLKPATDKASSRVNLEAYQLQLENDPKVLDALIASRLLKGQDAADLFDRAVQVNQPARVRLLLQGKYVSNAQVMTIVEEVLAEQDADKLDLFAVLLLGLSDEQIVKLLDLELEQTYLEKVVARVNDEQALAVLGGFVTGADEQQLRTTELLVPRLSLRIQETLAERLIETEGVDLAFFKIVIKSVHPSIQKDVLHAVLESQDDEKIGIVVGLTAPQKLPPRIDDLTFRGVHEELGRLIPHVPDEVADFKSLYKQHIVDDRHQTPQVNLMSTFAKEARRRDLQYDPLNEAYDEGKYEAIVSMAREHNSDYGDLHNVARRFFKDGRNDYLAEVVDKVDRPRLIRDIAADQDWSNNEGVKQIIGSMNEHEMHSARGDLHNVARRFFKDGRNDYLAEVVDKVDRPRLIRDIAADQDWSNNEGVKQIIGSMNEHEMDSARGDLYNVARRFFKDGRNDYLAEVVDKVDRPRLIRDIAAHQDWSNDEGIKIIADSTNEDEIKSALEELGRRGLSREVRVMLPKVAADKRYLAELLFKIIACRSTYGINQGTDLREVVDLILRERPDIKSLGPHRDVHWLRPDVQEFHPDLIPVFKRHGVSINDLHNFIRLSRELCFKMGIF